MTAGSTLGTDILNGRFKIDSELTSQEEIRTKHCAEAAIRCADKTVFTSAAG
jgi:hypothetical protein